MNKVILKTLNFPYIVSLEILNKNMPPKVQDSIKDHRVRGALIHDDRKPVGPMHTGDFLAFFKRFNKLAPRCALCISEPPRSVVVIINISFVTAVVILLNSLLVVLLCYVNSSSSCLSIHFNYVIRLLDRK